MNIYSCKYRVIFFSRLKYAQNFPLMQPSKLRKTVLCFVLNFVNSGTPFWKIISLCITLASLACDICGTDTTLLYQSEFVLAVFTEILRKVQTSDYFTVSSSLVMLRHLHNEILFHSKFLSFYYSFIVRELCGLFKKQLGMQSYINFISEQ